MKVQHRRHNRWQLSHTILLTGLCVMAACTSEIQLQPVTVFASTDSPPLLSQWGVVQSESGRLRLGENVLPYDLNTALFTDYAHKLRTVWIPPGKSIGFKLGEALDFPIGTILSKTFYYPVSGQHNADVLLANDDYSKDFIGHALDLRNTKLIETRLLVHQNDGWQALAYIWNDEQNEAILEIAGDIKTLSIESTDGEVSEFYYVIPTRNECASCHASDHTSGNLLPIGPKVRHLNKTYAHYKKGPADQLSTWHSKALLVSLPPIESLPRNALWDAHSRDQLVHRARSYLDINCSHCHNPKGSADTSGLFLHMAETTPRRLGNCKPPVAAGRGTGNLEFAIVPGKAKHSILAFRMETTDPGEMMPELGRSTVHKEGLELVSDWINSLQGDCV